MPDDHPHGFEAGVEDGFRLYVLLAFFDTRDGSPMADLVRSAREGYERCHPEMGEQENAEAWGEFDAWWQRRDPNWKPVEARLGDRQELVEAIAKKLAEDYFTRNAAPPIRIDIEAQPPVDFDWYKLAQAALNVVADWIEMEALRGK